MVLVRGATATATALGRVTEQIVEDHHDTDSISNKTATSLPHFPPFLIGVMVVAACHDFSVDWLELFMNDIHQMNFNTIHLTLTNNQRFAFTTVKDDDNEKKINNSNKNKNNNRRYYAMGKWEQQVCLPTIITVTMIDYYYIRKAI